MAQAITSRPKRNLEAYQHMRKERLNNPPSGLATPKTDPPARSMSARLRSRRSWKRWPT